MKTTKQLIYEAIELLPGLCAALSTTVEEVKHPLRTPVRVHNRFFIAKYLHDAGYGWSVIGGVLERDHATIIYAVRTCNNIMSVDNDYCLEYLTFKQKYEYSLLLTEATY